MKIHFIFVLKGQVMDRILWKPRIRVPDSQIMAKAIKTEFEKAKPYGYGYIKAMSVERFQIQTGKLRMNDAEAGELFEIIYPEFIRETSRS